MELYPVFLHLRGRPVLVVGAGHAASAKIGPLLAAGARITVVAPEIARTFRRPELELRQRPFAPADLDGMRLAIAAAPPAVNVAVARAAEARRIFVNAVDDAGSATADLGGVLRKGGITAAISTDGRAPALAALLREALEALLPDDLESWAGVALELRAQWKAEAAPLSNRRPLLLRALNELYGRTA